MNLYSTSDQARSLALQMASATAKRRLDVLSQELSSGRVADVPGHLDGNTRLLRSYEQNLSMLDQFQTSAREAAALADVVQNVLGSIGDAVSEIGVSLYSDSPFGSVTAPDLLARDAAAAFDKVVGRLNTQIGGQYVFAGLNLDQPALRPSGEILDELMSQTGGLPTASDVVAFVDDWFDRAPGGGGYLDFAYFGTTGQPRLMPVSESETMAFSVSAASPSVRQALKGLALGALVDRGALAGDQSESHALLQNAGHVLMDNRRPIASEQGRVGLLQQRIENSISANEAEKSLYQIAQSKLTTADPYDTATALTEAQTKMETIYKLTARLSNLKLVNYLR